MYFQHLREVPWNPTFEWVGTSRTAAHQINIHHEDYPKYVNITDLVIEAIKILPLSSDTLRVIHGIIFVDKPFKGDWRKVNVRVGDHYPPTFSKVKMEMLKLENLYRQFRWDTNLERIIEWYKDFETIHPFEDGNGRVGGVVVACVSNILHPERGYLAPNQ